MRRKISIHVVDDHPIIRDSLKEYFTVFEDDFVVAGVSADSQTAFKDISKTNPDVVILDIEIPGEDVFDLARKISNSELDTKILFFSAFLTDSYILEATMLPIFGYITKTTSLRELAAGVRTLVSGRHVFSKDVLERFPGGINSVLDKIPKTRLACLTVREREVLKYIANDMTGKEIAMKLGLSSRTVDRHKANIMDKLGIHSQVGLTRFAVAEGLCQPRTAIGAN